MAQIGILFCFLIIKSVCCYEWKCDNDNTTLPPTARQLLEFKLKNPKPIGLLTYGTGAPVDIRETVSINSDVFGDDYFFENQGHLNAERIPSRTVAAKGVGTWGYFEVTNDVSKYTKADVFTGIGKKTQALVRFAVGGPEAGGSDLNRDFKDMAVKLYTKHGILDILNLNTPMFAFKDPKDFFVFAHSFARRNPKTHILDVNIAVDVTVLKPDALTAVLYFLSDYGLPNGWRHADFFPIHTYELYNKHGDRWYVRFAWRTEQGTEYLTTTQALLLGDPDYYIRDLYNAIANKTYPSWRLEMDVLSLQKIQSVDFNPFDVTKLWKNGTYETVTVGRLVLTEFAENQFRDIEQAAFNPSSLVPGILGPVDTLFRGRRFAYRDTQNYRVLRNHRKVGVNSPEYMKTYTRDGHPPVGGNEDDAPIYYPNSFKGPIPYVDETRPIEQLLVLETNAVDLQEANDFYNKLLPDDAARQRLVNNIVLVFRQTLLKLRRRFIALLALVDEDFALRVIVGARALNITTDCEDWIVSRTALGRQNPLLSPQNPKLSTFDPTLSTYDPKFSTFGPTPSTDPKFSTFNPTPNTYDPKFSTSNPTLSTYDPNFSTYNPISSTNDPTLSVTLPSSKN